MNPRVLFFYCSLKVGFRAQLTVALSCFEYAVPLPSAEGMVKLTSNVDFPTGTRPLAGSMQETTCELREQVVEPVVDGLTVQKAVHSSVFRSENLLPRVKTWSSGAVVQVPSASTTKALLSA